MNRIGRTRGSLLTRREALHRTALAGAAFATLAPAGARAATLQQQVLHDFTGGADGRRPVGGLIQGTDGALYGHASEGGTAGLGTVFRYGPGPGHRPRLRVLHAFAGRPADGRPTGRLALGPDGSLYGLTGGGSDARGSVYRVAPDGGFSTVYRFGGNFAPDGSKPSGGLCLAGDGFFYGVTSAGGVTNGGTLFRLSTTGGLETLHHFGVTPGDGQTPWAALAVGPEGRLYGTTGNGGAAGAGTVFRVATDGTPEILHAFDGDDGRSPQAALVATPQGGLLGTTAYGGTAYAVAPEGAGTLFAIEPSGALTTIKRFAPGPLGYLPAAPLTLSRDGQAYGVTRSGGAGRGGTTFRFSGPTLEPVFDFPLNAGPTALLEASDGRLYGATESLGAFGGGTLYAFLR